MSEAFTDADYERVVRERDEAQARVLDAALIHAELVRERDEARREADRFRHGCTVEGDFVCPNEYAVSELTAERDEARANYQWMVDRACDEKLDGYRELGAKCAQLEQERDEAQEAYREARASRWHVSKKWDEALKEIERLRTENEDMGRALNEARAEVDKLSESAKAAWEAECVMREQRDRYHAEWKQERREVERLRADRDEWRDKFLALNQTAGELCNACGWAFKIPGEPCRCEVVRERDEARAEVEHAYREGGALYEAKIAEREAYHRGAEAMRARCEETARHACSVIGKLEHTYGIMTQGHIETVSRLILEVDIPEEP